jgi:hypothetical protein
MTGAVSVSAKEKGAALDLIQFLTATANLSVIKANGMER